MHKLKENGGFSLVEVMVAMVILGLITVPVLSGMLVAMKAMAASEEMMQSQLQVSSAVETMMEKGIDESNIGAGNIYTLSGHDNVTIEVVRSGTDLPYYNVTVTCKEHSGIQVETVIREEGGAA